MKLNMLNKWHKNKTSEEVLIVCTINKTKVNQEKRIIIYEKKNDCNVFGISNVNFYDGPIGVCSKQKRGGIRWMV